MVIRPNLTGISIWSFLEHDMTLNILLRELVGDIFERGGEEYILFQLTYFTHQSAAIHTHPSIRSIPRASFVLAFDTSLPPFSHLSFPSLTQ
jgi:hypothetical protein